MGFGVVFAAGQLVDRGDVLPRKVKRTLVLRSRGCAVSDKEVYQMDVDGDGELDTVEVTRHADGGATYLIDTDGDGKANMQAIDHDGDGVIDEVLIDHDGDGKIDSHVTELPQS